MNRLDTGVLSLGFLFAFLWMKNAFSVLDQLGVILPTLGGFLVLPQSHVV